MPSFQQSGFPTIQDAMDLARSIVNDMFPGIAGANGRVLTNDAPFTLPYLNSAFRKVQRKLRNEGVTFPIKDNVILLNLTPVITVDPSVEIFVDYNGYFDGTTLHSSPKLPSDLVQPLAVDEQTAGNTGTPYVTMTQPGRLPSANQGTWLGVWEWRNYKIYMIGSTLTKNLRLRYTSGQPPIDVPASAFSSTAINIQDSADAIATEVARLYARARGAADVTSLETDFESIIDDMAVEYVRRAQSVVYRRPAYGGGGSNDQGNAGPTGQTQVGI